VVASPVASSSAFGQSLTARARVLTVEIERTRFERGHVDGRGRPDAGRPDAGVRPVTPRALNGSLSLGAL
jgi:hypothetical protein